MRRFGFALVLIACLFGSAGRGHSIDNSGCDYDVRTNAFEMTLGVGIPLVKEVEAE